MFLLFPSHHKGMQKDAYKSPLTAGVERRNGAQYNIQIHLQTLYTPALELSPCSGAKHNTERTSTEVLVPGISVPGDRRHLKNT